AAELLEHLGEHYVASFRKALSHAQVAHFLHGMLQRLRLKGGIEHPLLHDYAREGSRFFLSKAKNPRLSRFGPQSSVPQFWYQGEAKKDQSNPKNVYQPLHSQPSARNWYRVWAARALDMRKENDAGMNSLIDRAVRVLRAHGLVTTLSEPGKNEVSGINPQATWVTRQVYRVSCTACGHQLTLAEPSAHSEHPPPFVGRPCLKFSCVTGSYQRTETSNAAETYYQKLYRS